MCSAPEAYFPECEATEITNCCILHQLCGLLLLRNWVIPCGISLCLIGCSQDGSIQTATDIANDSGPADSDGTATRPSVPPFGDSPANSPLVAISPGTTFVTAPVSEDGAIDIVAAINAKYGAGVKAEENAAAILYDVIGPRPEGTRQPDLFFERMGVSAPPETGNFFVDLGTHLKQTEGIERNDSRMTQSFEEQNRAMARPWKKAELARIGGWLDANEASLQLVIDATRRPGYFSPVVLQRTELNSGAPSPERGLLGQLLPGVQATRSLARALVARAMLHLGEGRTEAAWNDLLAVHRLGRLVAQGPTLIEGLVGFALDSIASAAIVTLLEHGQADDALLQRMERDLNNAPPLADMADKVDFMERLIYIDSALLAAAGGQQAEEVLAVENADAIVRLLHQPGFPAIDWNVALSTGNQWYDRMVAAMRETEYSRRSAALEAINGDLKKIGKDLGDQAGLQQALQGKETKAAVGSFVGELLVALLLPATSAAQHAEDRAVQQHLNLRVALALCRFRGEHARYPEQLAELVPKYRPELPGDLFSAQPLKYARIDKGYLLYSIGPNGEDDGGRNYDSQPPGDDIAVKLAGYN
jgi:hypothetical protein